MNSATLGTPALRVDFQRHGDRYRHQVSCYFPNATAGLLISEEGQPDDAWPLSPVLQSLHLETRAEGVQLAMLVGMAGRSHWSMTVEANAKQNHLLFDMACRINEQPVWLGSTYNCCNQHRAAWPLECLSVQAWQGDGLEQKILLETDRLAGTVRIPARHITGNFPQTVRWRYFVGLRE